MRTGKAAGKQVPKWLRPAASGGLGALQAGTGSLGQDQDRVCRWPLPGGRSDATPGTPTPTPTPTPAAGHGHTVAKHGNPTAHCGTAAAYNGRPTTATPTSRIKRPGGGGWPQDAVPRGCGGRSRPVWGGPREEGYKRGGGRLCMCHLRSTWTVLLQRVGSQLTSVRAGLTSV